MDGNIKVDKVTMINPRGSLRSVQSMMVPELKAQGWKIVVNPKRDYFPELDNQNKGIITGEITEDSDQSRMLPYEEV